MQQLREPTDNMFALLQVLSLLMIESQHSPIPRQRYFYEVLTIPAIKKALDEEDSMSPISPDGKCRPSSRNALNMMAATFDSDVKGPIFSNPFPALTTAKENRM